MCLSTALRPSLQPPSVPDHIPSVPHSTLESPVASLKVKPESHITCTVSPGLVSVVLSEPWFGVERARHTTEGVKHNKRKQGVKHNKRKQELNIS